MSNQFFVFVSGILLKYQNIRTFSIPKLIIFMSHCQILAKTHFCVVNYFHGLPGCTIEKDDQVIVASPPAAVDFQIRTGGRF